MTLWGGRFEGKLDPAAWVLNASLPVDQRFGALDVQGSLAWARGLYEAGVLSKDEHRAIEDGLEAIGKELRGETFVFQPGDEDIHTAVERRLGELIGPVAGKLHTGRSRNDQVATDFRLWVLEALPAVDKALAGLQAALIGRAEAAGEILVPGYTHLQRAQPLLLSHWWMSHFWPLQRDRERLVQLSRRVAVLPLGCGALAGTPIPVDRHELAYLLGFERPAQNSIDSISDRDFAAEVLFCAAMIGIHLSRLAETVVLYSSMEFGFFELSDAYSTGSSLMPQKKNPDMFELARGKAAVLVGQLTGMLTMLKGLPSTYDKDLQEDKPPVFHAVDTLLIVLPVLAGALDTIMVRPERMRAAIDAGMMATDLADYLVGKGIPFREAHALTGKAVRLAMEKGVALDSLPLEDFHSLCECFEADVYQVFDPLVSVKRRKAYGGTAPEAVAAQIEEAKLAMKGG